MRVIIVILTVCLCLPVLSRDSSNDADTSGIMKVQEQKIQSRIKRQSSCTGIMDCFQSYGLVFSQSEKTKQLRFFLYTRANPKVGQEMESSKESIAESFFEPSRPTKFILHGFRSNEERERPQSNKNIFLKLGHFNVVLVDWRKMASANYPRAATNAEVMGRELAYFIELLVKSGATPRDFHLIGCSLGAHIAGYAGKTLKSRGIRLAKITGVDPAGFLFQSTNLLMGIGIHKSDADFVEIIHTFGGSVLFGRLGVWRPVGHVDFFVNGGGKQPNCSDTSNLLEVAIYINRRDERMCSHRRAWDLYLESLTSECKFVGIPCPGLQNFEKDFVHGDCFSCEHGSCGVIGLNTEKSRARGSLYLMTHTDTPYCGDQLRAVIGISRQTESTRGELQLHLEVDGRLVTFRMNSELENFIEGGQTVSSVTVAEHGFLRRTNTTDTISAMMSFAPYFTLEYLNPHDIYVHSATVKDHNGNSWHYCGDEIILEEVSGKSPLFQLTRTPC